MRTQHLVIGMMAGMSLALGPARASAIADEMPAQLPVNQNKVSGCTLTDVIPRITVPASLAKTEVGRHLVQARNFFDYDDFTNAFLECRQALSQAPNNYLCHYMLGSVLMGLLDFAEAGREFHQALTLEPGQAEVHFSVCPVTCFTNRVPA